MKSARVVTGIVFNIQRFSTQDGPGIRTTVFLKGCSLTCLWCSNPESQNPAPQVAHRDSLCTGCGECLKVCAPEAISVKSSDGAFKIKIDRGKCTNCGKCIDVCSTGALKVYGQTMSVDEVFDEIRRDIVFYSNSGGGVTASGGEPLSHENFVAGLFHRCKEIGIHTTLDTCGYARASALEKVLTVTDLVLFDLKVMNSRYHRRLTGRYNEVILRNASLVVAKGVPMIIRIPLIPGITDSEENIVELARFVFELDKKLHIDLLLYHRLGESKYKMLDKVYQLTDVKPPDEEQVQRAAEIFKRHGLDCAIGN